MSDREYLPPFPPYIRKIDSPEDAKRIYRNGTGVDRDRARKILEEARECLQEGEKLDV